MKPKILFLLALGLVASRLPAGTIGTAFTYQGYLSGAGTAAAGYFDLQFTLFDAANNGNQVGPTLTNLDVGVNNGLFTVTLDFGNVFDGNARWLALGVRTNGNTSGGFTALTPLQPLTPTPNALYATNAGTAGNVINNSVSAAQLSTPGGSPALGEVLGYNGTNLVWTSGSSNASGGWGLTGNAGTTAGVNFLGTTDLRALEFRVGGVRGWQMMPTLDTPNLIGGSPGNYVSGAVQGATIGGGGTITTYGRAYSNSVFAYHGTIGGGLGNTIQINAYESTIAGGNQNSVQSGANDSSIGGGYVNTIQSAAGYSTIAGGNQNSIQSGAYDSSIAGGAVNTIQSNAFYSAIAGGQNNTINNSARNATISGGLGNSVLGPGSMIGGGYSNTVFGAESAISGGENNEIFEGNEAFIGGGQNNSIDYVSNASISGGYGNGISDDNSAIGGGFWNEIYYNASNSVIAGGISNSVLGAESAVGGGTLNYVGIGGQTSVIGGGYSNAVNGEVSAIGGGSANFIDSTAASVIGGGYNNFISAAAPFSTIPGGNNNLANATLCFAAGNHAQAQNQGCFVWADSQTHSFASTANDQFCVRAQGGVQLDPTTSISCGFQTRQMLNLWGAGYGIGVQNNREYFRAGDTNAGFSWFMGGTHNDTADNPGNGGVEVMNLTYGLAGIGPGGPGAFSYEAGVLHIMGQLNVDANAYASDFYSTSDRNKKENFGPVDARTILDKVSALPITTWNFKGRRERHLGPMAQDFRAAFDLSPDDKHISVLDEAGVALAAIQGLNQKWEEHDQEFKAAMKEKDAKIARLEEELAEVKSAQRQTMAELGARFDALRKDMARVADKSEDSLAAASQMVGPK